MALFFIGIMSLLGMVAIILKVGGSTGRKLISKHDELYQLPLGSLPGPQGAPVRRVTRADMSAPVAVRFEPPTGVLPEQVGMLTRGEPQSSDIAAAMIALAVEGYVRITPVVRTTRVLRRRHKDWELTALRPVDDSLNPLRAELLQMLFSVGRPTQLSWLKTSLSSRASDMKRDLARWPQHELWFPHLHGGRVPLSKCLTTPGLRRRTALGAALRYQNAGFKHFLETADGNRLRFEEGAGWFSRYLPWAVALGVTREWVAAFREAAEGLDGSTGDVWAADLAWYGDMDGFDFSGFDSFGDALDSLEDGLNDLASDLSDAGGDGGGDGGDGGGGD
ncbi:DUF2207 family protein [Luteococcus sp. OSA5]|uniref:DUF2207 family protein n=1 Tax=Luteococcus sp. OSA5 TaxID=3401630 RepID=UPI003B438847